MDFLTMVSIFSLLMTIAGLYLLGEKSRNGFVLFTFSLIAQLYIFIIHKNTFLIIQMLVLITFNTWNYFKWGRKESVNE